MNECDLIYECKVCRSLHRSLANFIAHKRVYCMKHCCETMLLFDNEDIENETVIVQPESPDSVAVNEDDAFVGVSHSTTENGESNGEAIVDQKEIKVITPNIMQPLQSIKQKETVIIDNIYASYMDADSQNKSTHFYDKCLRHLESRDVSKSNSVLQLETISENHNAVLQTVRQSDVAAEITLQDDDAGIQYSSEDQHLESQETTVKKSVNPVGCCSCFMCGATFTSVKTMTFHLKSIHAKRRVYFPCPFCNAMFSQLWGVVRHLLTIHKKTKEQVNKLRSKIRQKALQRAAADKDSGDETEVVSKRSGLRATSPVISDSVSPMVRLTKDLDVIKCSRCDIIFTQKEALDAHKKSCSISDSSDEKVCVEPEEKRKTMLRSSSDAVPSRPKRIVKKKEAKDFVSSTHLNIRTNMVSKGENVKRAPPTIEKKILAIINIKKLQCVQCNRTFTTLSNLRRHAATHVGWNRYKCKYCDYQSYSRSECRNHVKRVHITKRQLQNQVDKFVVDLPEEDDDKSMELEEYLKEETKGSPLTGARSPNKKSNKQMEYKKSTPPKKNQVAQANKITKSVVLSTLASIKQENDVESSLMPHTGSKSDDILAGDKSPEELTLEFASGNHKTGSTSPGKRLTTVSNVGSFNISTRLSPRTFDTSPYRRSDTLPTLVTRSGAYIKSSLLNQNIKDEQNILETPFTMPKCLKKKPHKQVDHCINNNTVEGTRHDDDDDEDDDEINEHNGNTENSESNIQIKYSHHGDHNYSAELHFKDDTVNEV